MNLTMVRWKSKSKEVILQAAYWLVVLSVILCGLWGALMGDLATNWTLSAKEAHLVMNESHYGERFAKDGVTYELIPLPEGMDVDAVRAKIDLRRFDEIQRGEITYLVYEDPLGTGKTEILFVPLERVGQDKTPLTFYAKVVSAE